MTVESIDTEARRKLAAWMAEDPKYRSRGFIARSLGVSQPAVTGWLKGHSRPEADLRPGIQVLTSGVVHPDDWKSVKERAREATALRLASDAISKMPVVPAPPPSGPGLSDAAPISKRLDLASGE